MGPVDGATGRIRYIQKSLDDGTGRAMLWWYGWVGFYAAATIVPLTAALTSRNGTLQVTGGVSAAESLVGLSGMLVFPFTAKDAAENLRSMPESTPEEKAKKLLAAETLLRESAEDETTGSSWIQHTLGVLVNAAGALVIWQGYGGRIRRAGGEPWEQALISFVVGTSVSELQIWTEPTKAMADYKDYRDKYPSSGPSPDARLMVLPLGNGLELAAAVRF
ncbi:MAG: hypothetical protein M1491_09110 [Deltaproteobacteria bacterium]|nr:hypothetical protein [Deltaproteobacteria bacterium]